MEALDRLVSRKVIRLLWQDDCASLFKTILDSKPQEIHWYVPHLLIMQEEHPPPFPKPHHYLHYTCHTLQRRYGIELDDYFFGCQRKKTTLFMWAGSQNLNQEITTLTQQILPYSLQRISFFPAELWEAEG